MKENPWFSFFHDIGTSAMIPGSVMNGRLPIKNWAGSILDMPDLEEISGENFIKRQEKRYGCWNCPMHCGGIMKQGLGEYQYAAGVHKPEYETIGAFGSMCLNSDIESIILANDARKIRMVLNSPGAITVRSSRWLKRLRAEKALEIY
jgi:aldehyde:ferredoxin oxidoreductase